MIDQNGNDKPKVPNDICPECGQKKPIVHGVECQCGLVQILHPSRDPLNGTTCRICMSKLYYWKPKGWKEGDPYVPFAWPPGVPESEAMEIEYRELMA